LHQFAQLGRERHDIAVDLEHVQQVLAEDGVEPRDERENSHGEGHKVALRQQRHHVSAEMIEGELDAEKRIQKKIMNGNAVPCAFDDGRNCL